MLVKGKKGLGRRSGNADGSPPLLDAASGEPLRAPLEPLCLLERFAIRVASSLPFPLPLDNSALSISVSLHSARSLIPRSRSQHKKRATAIEPPDRGGEAWNGSRDKGMCVREWCETSVAS